MLHGRLLRYLDEVARSGSIRKAAERLNVAASAINRQILSLEEELETALFERMPGGLRLTATGEIMIAHVRDTLRDHQRTLARVAGLKGLTEGEVVIATMGGLAASILGEVLGGIRVKHPRIRLVVRVLPRDGIVEAVLDGDADLGLGYNIPSHPRLFRAMSFEHPVGAVLAPSHPLVGRMSVRFADCLPYPLLMAERGMSLRQAIDLLIPPNVDAEPVLETNSLELLKHMARCEPCVTFMSLLEVREELKAGVLAFIPMQGARTGQSVSLVHRASGAVDPIVSLVAKLVAAGIEQRHDDI